MLEDLFKAQNKEQAAQQKESEAALASQTRRKSLLTVLLSQLDALLEISSVFDIVDFFSALKKLWYCLHSIKRKLAERRLPHFNTTLCPNIDAWVTSEQHALA
ncbi:unnamed protein product [Peronospora destructor]|uniref:Uncharacterized protein n=1 Tax=Peronospora destructor TaxID=86335 RepID=A0AAV0T626_9STRA|nr:unnamed protein product [Peronospora destructor]